MSTERPEQENKLGCEGFHSRLRELLKKFKSNNAFAVAAGISPDRKSVV